MGHNMADTSTCLACKILARTSDNILYSVNADMQFLYGKRHLRFARIANSG